MTKKKTLDDIVGVEKPKEVTQDAVPQKTKELSKREKVKLMHDLTGACENKQLVDIIRGLPNGERVYDIFVSAVDKEIEIIMNGKANEDVSQEVVDTVKVVRETQAVLQNFKTVISHFHETPLVKTLESLNASLGGRQIQQVQYQDNSQQINQVRSSGGDDVGSARASLNF